MHALVKKNENAERYSQNSCKDVRKNFNILLIHGRFAKLTPESARAAPGRVKGMFAQTPKFNLQSRKKKKNKGKTREVNTQITYVIILRLTAWGQRRYGPGTLRPALFSPR
jgi:hypothetical protein